MPRLTTLVLSVFLVGASACRSQLIEPETDGGLTDGPRPIDFTLPPLPDFTAPPPPDFRQPPLPDFTVPPVVDLATATCPEPGGPVPLDVLRKAIVGGWYGVATSPWSPAYNVKMSFDFNGLYSAHSTDSSSPPAFYYGVDDDAPVKKYSINNVLSNGDGMGDIAIYWGGGQPTQGSLEHIRFCGPNFERLSFEFWPLWLGRIGPVRYELNR